MLGVIIRLAAILMVGGALAATIAAPAAWPCLVVALLFATGCLYERRYRSGQGGGASDHDFQPTGERFIDPETGQPTAAWSRPDTGERLYKSENSLSERDD